MSSHHVMLSYQWDNQKRVEKVYDCMRAEGINAWMDIKGGMQGNINDRSVTQVCGHNSLLVQS